MSQEYQNTQFQTGSEPSRDGFQPPFLYAMGYQEHEKVFPNRGDMPLSGGPVPHFTSDERTRAPFYAYVYPLSSPPAFSSGPGTMERMAGAATYALGWFSALIFLLFVPRNRFVRYHALQSLIFFGLVNIIDVLGIITLHSYSMFHMHNGIAALFLLLLNFIACIGWGVGVIGALCGKFVALPLVSGFAEQHSQGILTKTR